MAIVFTYFEHTSSKDHIPFQANKQFMRKLPEGAEAANVLIGEVATVTRPILVLVRLKEAELLPGLTEVHVKTRYNMIVCTTHIPTSEIKCEPFRKFFKKLIISLFVLKLMVLTFNIC